MSEVRYITFSISELIIAQRAVEEAIIAACHRNGSFKLTALCQVKEHFLLTLTPVSAAEATQDVRFEQLTAADLDTLTGALTARWQGGYDPVGVLADTDADGAPRCFLFSQRCGMP